MPIRTLPAARAVGHRQHEPRQVNASARLAAHVSRSCRRLHILATSREQLAIGSPQAREFATNSSTRPRRQAVNQFMLSALHEQVACARHNTTQWADDARHEYALSLVEGVRGAIKNLGLAAGTVGFDDLRLAQHQRRPPLARGNST